MRMLATLLSRNMKSARQSQDSRLLNVLCIVLEERGLEGSGGIDLLESRSGDHLPSKLNIYTILIFKLIHSTNSKYILSTF